MDNQFLEGVFAQTRWFRDKGLFKKIKMVFLIGNGCVDGGNIARLSKTRIMLKLIVTFD